MPKASKLFQALAKLINPAPFNLSSRAVRESLRKKKKKRQDENGMEEVSWHGVNTEALLLHEDQ